MTNGAIDPTILPLSDLWNFGENDSVPSSKAIADSLFNVGYENVIIDKATNTVTLTNSNAGIDLGFIAKGYIADKMKEYLLSNGVESALINLGGNVLTIGNKPDGSPYVLGIQEPFSDGQSSIPNVSIRDKSLVTSGVYERYFYEDNILYHHILDTKTGYPIDNDLFGVTILSESSMEGDAYSTICLCLGLEDGMKVIEKTEGLEALFITNDMELHYSSEFPQ
jgi:thiamine biosynthesis lipoprotein